MGWTSYHATHYKKSGAIDRKAECDAYFMEGLNAGFFRVVKSSLVGTVYYAAVEPLKRYGKKDASGNYQIEDIPENERCIHAEVFLTSVNIRDYFNFAYKDMSESMGPCEDNCPSSILDLLSPTDDEWALEWRKRCRANIEARKDPNALKNLPVGTVIRFTMRDEARRIEAMKHRPAFQFKRPFWYIPESGNYIPYTRIPKDYEIVSSIN